MLENIKKYEKVIAVIGGLSLITLIALWLLSRSQDKTNTKSPKEVPDGQE